METNESLKTALVQQTEASVLKMIEQLQTVPEGQMQELEHCVMSACLSVGQRWLETVLNHPRAETRPKARRQGACGHRQRLVGERPKQLLTLVGKVTVRRPYYQCQIAQGTPARAQCTHGEAPFDEVWGVQARRSSPGVQKLASYLAASMTLEEAANVFEAILPLKISARQVQSLVQPVGEALIGCEDRQKEKIFQEATNKRTSVGPREQERPEGIERMYIEVDGVLARLRRGSVPLEKEEDQRTGDVYREIKVGAVFTAMRGRTRSALAAGTFLDQPGPIHYVARRTTADTFGHYLYALAQLQGIEHAQQVVVIADGAVWIWRLVAEHFPQAVQIVDLWHAREHVWKVAHAVFERGSQEEAAWARHACDLLSEGRIEDLVAEIAALPPVPLQPGAARSVPEIEMSYFISNAARMRYPAFRRQGMQIGSGIAEAACKTVVSTRTKRAGMRWTPQGLDAVLALRVAVLNGTYHSFWKQRPHLLA